MAFQSKRRTERKIQAFYVSYSVDGVNYIPGHGLDFSLAGMRILTDAPIPSDEILVRLNLATEDLHFAARKVWERDFQLEEETWIMAGLQFVGKPWQNPPA